MELRNLPSDYDLIITGDFNAPDICWPSLSAHQSFSKDICNIFFSLNLVQLINSPTHVCGNTLDIVATNTPDRLRNVIVDDKNKFCCSDHHFISFGIAIRHSQARPVEPRKIKLYSRATHITNYLSMHACPAQIDPFWSLMSSALSSACQLYVPSITISRKNLPKLVKLGISLNKSIP